MLTSFHRHPDRDAIDTARHHAFMKEVLPHLIAGIATAVLVYILFHDFSNQQQERLWLASNISLLLISITLYTIYYKKHALFSISQWRYIPCIVSLCWGCSWALAPFLFLDDSNVLYAALLTIILLALSTAPAPAMAYYPSAYLAFISLPFISLSIVFFTSNLIDNWLISLLPIFTLLSLWAYGWNLHGTMIKILRLDIEKTKALKIAEDSNIAKSKFLAAASHDIRQPLQAINLFLSALSDRNQNAEDKVLFERLVSSVNSMSELLNSLLDISRLDAQVININPQHITIKPICEKLLNELEQQNNYSKPIVFKARCDDLTAFADPVLLKRVISNLLSNALRYTDKGVITLSAKFVDSNIIISVNDSGIGISDEEKNAIFTEFYQVGNPERDKKKGLGLGLSIVKRLCDLHDWPLAFMSEKNGGSVFSIAIETGDATQIVSDTTLSPSINLQSISALVIDDEESIRQGLHSLLSNWGCSVHTFSSENLALDALQTATCPRPNLIISDYRLREHETGIKAIKTIRDYFNCHIEAILITGDTDKERMRDAKESGLIVLHKPIKPARLRKSIQMAMKDIL